MKIIYQDKALIIADKPPRVESADFAKQFNVPIDRGGLVHRLDKDTSGLLVIAKEQITLENLQQQFRNHTVKKVYTALVYGQMESRQGSINAPIAWDPKRKQAMKVIPFATEGERGKRREAVTTWESINELKIKSQKLKIALSLLKVTIHTGRTHQIRVHMQYIGHPILGDPMYNTREGREVSKKLRLERQFLHASELGFKHPETGEWIEFRSKLPEDLLMIIKK